MAPGSSQGPPPSRRTAVGTVRILGGMSLKLALGAALQIFLPRALGAKDFATYAVAMSIVNWIEVGAIGPAGRALAVFVAEAGERWRPIARTAVSGVLAVSTLAALLLIALAPLVAAALRDPGLTIYIRLAALELPLFMAWVVFQNVLNGRRLYEREMITLNAYWLVRLAVVVGLVSAGFSVKGAILGTVVAGVFGAWVGGRLSGMGSLAWETSLRPLVRLSWPLAVAALAAVATRSVDLWIVKSVLPDPAAAGHYAVAMLIYLALLPLVGSVGQAAMPTMVRARAERNAEALGELARQAYRFALLVGLMAMAVFIPAAHEIVTFVFGAQYAPAGLPAALLMWAMLLTAVGGAGGAVHVAAGRPGPVMTSGLAGLLIAVPLNLLLVPAWELTGAAAATIAASAVTALMLALSVRRTHRAAPALPAVLRLGAVALVIYAVGMVWPVSGAWVLGKATLLAAAYLAGLGLCGELTRRDMQPVLAALSFTRRARR